MKTGEGKTLVATLPSYLNALAGKGVHVITVNDYLAEYQSELMGRVHRALGMETGCILADDDAGAAARRVRQGHHLRHQQRVRLRLPARQHGVGARGARPARPQLLPSSTRSTRSSSTRPARRSSSPARADAADQVVRRVRQDRAAAEPRRGRPRRLRGRREEAHRRRPRDRHREGRGPARHREPLRVGQHAAHRLPQQRHQGQGAVQEATRTTSS